MSELTRRADNFVDRLLKARKESSGVQSVEEQAVEETLDNVPLWPVHTRLEARRKRLQSRGRE